jgi:glycosyltransferase involved in cell wall biosynthesis
MRICLLSLDYWPHRSSGLTIYAEDLARGLGERGHAVTVIAARRPGTAAHAMAGGIAVHRAPIGISDWIMYSARAARLLEGLHRQRPYDVVHVLDIHFAYRLRLPFVASIWQSFRQRLHADGGRTYASGRLNYAVRRSYYAVARHWMERASLARAGRLIAACESTAREFIDHYRVAPGRIDRVVQGTALGALGPVPTGQLRRRLGLDGRRIVLFVGFATARKGLEYLAAAMRLLPPDVVWVMAGCWEPGYRDKVLRVLGDATARLVEVGYIEDDERAAYYSLADVYVSPSMLEGFGLTPIEAQACGTPAIVTDASSGPEEVGDAGIVVPARDAAALAVAIKRLLDDPALRAELGARAYARVHRQFSYQAMAAQTEASYQRFLDER